MSTIKTARNYVYTYEPEPGHDMIVEILVGPGDGSNIYRQLLVQPISQWQAAVDWAVGIADQMVHPIHVAAVGARSFVSEHGEQIQRAVADLPDQERDELRQDMINTCVTAMRNCADHNVRADAFDVLAKLGIVTHEQ